MERAPQERPKQPLGGHLGSVLAILKKMHHGTPRKQALVSEGVAAPPDLPKYTTKKTKTQQLSFWKNQRLIKKNIYIYIY